MLPHLSMPYDECCLEFWNFPFSVLQFNPRCGQEFVCFAIPFRKTQGYIRTVTQYSRSTLTFSLTKSIVHCSPPFLV